jgi:hypothetical protein
MLPRLRSSHVDYTSIAEWSGASLPEGGAMTVLRVSPSGPEVEFNVQSVDSVAVLVALPAAVPGQLVRVETLGRSFVATPPGTSTPVAMVVIDGDGVQWHSVDATSDARWLEQLDWEVDGTAGNDESSGLPGSPLATISEIARRWGPSPVLGAGIRTIRLLSAPADGLFILQWDRTSEDCRVDIIDASVRTVLASGLIASYTGFSVAGNDCPIIEVTGVDFTSLVDKRLDFGSGTTARVVHANPNGLGVSFARITRPYTQPANWNSRVAPSAAVVGQSVSITELGIPIDSALICCNGEFFRSSTAAPTTRPYCVVNGFQFRRSVNVVSTTRGLSVRLVDTDARDVACVPMSVEQSSGSVSCRGQGEIEHLLSGVLINRGPDNIGLQDVIFGVDWTIGHTDVVSRAVKMYVYDRVVLYRFAVYDTPAGGAFQLHNGSFCWSTEGIVGRDNATGIMLSGTCDLVASGGVANIVIQGTTQIQTPSGAIVTADLPRDLNTGSGEATLVGGTVAVTIAALPADARFTVSRKTLGGVPGVQLTWVVAGNVVTFTSDVATDTSVIQYVWHSRNTRRGSIKS